MRTFSKGDYIFQAGEPVNNIYQIQRGKVKLTVKKEDSTKSLILQVLKENQVFGLLEIYTNEQVRRCTAVAMDKKVVIKKLSLFDFSHRIFLI